MLPARALLLTLLSALAGCTAENPALEGQLPGGPAGPGGAEGGGNATYEIPANATADEVLLPAPLWHRGDWWRFTVSSPEVSGQQQLVVVGETAKDYLTATADLDDAVAQAFFGRTLPGPVHKQHLSGYEQGIPAHFFDFPLADGKTWVLHLRAEDFLVHANFTSRAEGSKGPGFAVAGAAAGGDTVQLAFAPEVRWFTVFRLGSGGNTTFVRALAASGSNYTGTAFTAQSEDLYQQRRNGTGGNVPADGFTQPRAYSQLRLLLAAQGTGSVALQLVDPAGRTQYNATLPLTGGSVRAEVDQPSVPGSWKAVWSVEGLVDATLRIAGIDVQETKLG
jgi:hypothetical protein